MKNKYERMNSEQQKNIRKLYYQSEKGKTMMIRLNRLLIIGILGIILATCLGIYNYTNNKNLWDYVSASILLIVSIIFIFKSIHIRAIEFNKQALKEKN